MPEGAEEHQPSIKEDSKASLNISENKQDQIGSPSFDVIGRELGVEPVNFINKLHEYGKRIRGNTKYIYDNLGDASFEGIKDIISYAEIEEGKFRSKQGLSGDPLTLKKVNGVLQTVDKGVTSGDKNTVDKALVDFAMSRFEHFYNTLDQRIEKQAAQKAQFMNKSPEETKIEVANTINRGHIDNVYDGLNSYLKEGVWRTKTGTVEIKKEKLKSTSDFVIERIKSVEVVSTSSLADGKVFAPDKYKEQKQS